MRQRSWDGRPQNVCTTSSSSRANAAEQIVLPSHVLEVDERFPSDAAVGVAMLNACTGNMSRDLGSVMALPALCSFLNQPLDDAELKIRCLLYF